MKKFIKACFVVFAFLAAVVVFAPKTFAKPVPVLIGGEIPVDDIVINDLEIEIGETGQMTATVYPENATFKRIIWSSLTPSVATCDSQGHITGVSCGTARIKATINDFDGKKTEVHTVKVKSEWTIMVYMCGNNLSSCANDDIAEMLSVTGQPNDVNVIIQTGGSKSWASRYGIDGASLSRYHIRNNQLILDEKKDNQNMGLSSTFQDFLVWGMKNYPARKNGVVLWNHGGGMSGVCFDQNYYDDGLLNSEVKEALTGSFNSTGRTEKLEFIGYDACLMQVQDIAEFNSRYFKYMVASQDGEPGDGWDYDSWLDDVYAKKATTAILKEIVDGYIKTVGKNWTMSYLNLAYMNSYLRSWEGMASSLTPKIASVGKNTFNNLLVTVKKYGSGLYDAKDFLNKISVDNNFNAGTAKLVITNYNKLVEYYSGNGSNGLCMFWNKNRNNYTKEETNFNNWRNLMASFAC